MADLTVDVQISIPVAQIKRFNSLLQKFPDDLWNTLYDEAKTAGPQYKQHVQSIYQSSFRGSPAGRNTGNLYKSLDYSLGRTGPGADSTGQPWLYVGYHASKVPGASTPQTGLTQNYMHAYEDGWKGSRLPNLGRLAYWLGEDLDQASVPDKRRIVARVMGLARSIMAGAYVGRNVLRSFLASGTTRSITQQAQKNTIQRVMSKLGGK
jgi:hypothetical protein